MTQICGTNYISVEQYSHNVIWSGLFCYQTKVPRAVYNLIAVYAVAALKTTPLQ